MRCKSVNISFAEIRRCRFKNLMSKNELYHCLENSEFKNIQIEDLSEAVFSGFANYVNQHLNSKNLKQKAKDWISLKSG